GNSYVWSPVTGLSSSAVANPLAFPANTTSYIVNGTDTNFCVNNDTVVVTINPLPTINAGTDTSFCFGGSVQLTATGGTSYLWTPSLGLSDTTIANPVANPIVSTVYTVVGMDGNSCANTDSVLVTVNPLPVINAGADTAICMGASAQLNATGGTSYVWSPSLGLSDTTIANPVATPIVTTTYIVNALDGNSCANADTITVTVNNLPVINAGSDVAICFGDTTQLLASGGNSYVWSPVTGLSSSAVANPLAFPANTTSYIVNGTDNNLCVNNDTVVVTVNPLPTVNAGVDTSFCIGGSVQLNASGATGYVWSPSTGLSNTVIANPIANPITTTLYTVTGTDGNTCSNSDAVLVTVNPLPTITAFSDTAICIGASAQLNATGGTSYVWSPSATLSNPNVANPVATPIVTTTYIVNALDGNSCANADTITVTVNNLPVINAGSDVAICFGDTTQLLASGGNSYVWSPVTGLSSSAVADPLAFPANTTSYIVNGTDNNLCVNNDTVVVTVNPLPIISIGVSDTVYLCLGDSTQLIATGGVSYQWAPNTFISNTSIFNPFVYPPNTTTYTVIGTDLNSCKNKDTILVSVFTVPNLTDTTICIGDSLQLNVSGPINATYTWSPTTNLSNPNIANPYTNTTITITYNVIVQNAGGCTDTTSITVVAVDKPLADFTIETSLSCDGILVNYNNQSTLANNYVWNFGDGQQSTLVNPSHVFNYGTSVITILTAISINGCTDTYSIPIINGNFEDLFNLTPASVFTPNRDGFNDLFRLDLPEDMGTCTNVQIFNRWGMLVFEAINQNIGWDGRTTTGTEVPAGTYFYIVEVNGIVKKGTLTLFR
ncbi:MAG: gliding motility-associated C-terminal domain-containing protein, partial [Bacteroidetes bacterium]|nr:gliding motility-associated C-terminal domain-containing protein [Bacteroidota bacterium]